jgi:hypothetical protein
MGPPGSCISSRSSCSGTTLAREDIRVIITGDDEKGWRFSDRRMRKDGFIKGLDGTFVGR